MLVALVIAMVAVVAAMLLAPWPEEGVEPSGSRGFVEGTAVIWLLRRFPGWSRPTVLALVFAVLAFPIVALTLGAVDPTSGREPLPAGALGQWSAAAGGVFLPALVAGTVGGPIVRRNSGGGALLTMLIALLVAIPGVLLLPLVLDQRVGFGWLCIDGCSSLISTQNPLVGIQADLYVGLAPLVEPVPVLTLAVGVGLWTFIVRRLPQFPEDAWTHRPSRREATLLTLSIALVAVAAGSLAVGTRLAEPPVLPTPAPTQVSYPTPAPAAPIAVTPTTFSCLAPTDLTVVIELPASVAVGQKIWTEVDGPPDKWGDYAWGLTTDTVPVGPPTMVLQADGRWLYTLFFPAAQTQRMCAGNGQSRDYAQDGMLVAVPLLTPGDHAIKIIDPGTGWTLAQGAYTVLPYSFPTPTPGTPGPNSSLH